MWDRLRLPFQLPVWLLPLVALAWPVTTGPADAAEPANVAADGALQLTVRHRVETAEGSGRFHAVYRDEQWNPVETAVIVCDMWDLHHCLNATRRGAELAPRMNEVLKNLRERGATIIHAPSGCMETYKDHPARQRAMATPRSERLPEDIGQWCHRIPSEERGEYPVDQSDGGEDDDPDEHAAWAKKLADMGRNPRAPWKSQTELLQIDAERDLISDSGEEIWSILESRGIDNVILVGVHTNMCVLGRPFGLRQMAKNGKHVVLMRDMTDTMYNPQKAPFVSHFSGTDLIVEHIEKFVCPTVTSDQVLGGEPFRFENDKRPRLVFVIAEDEYQTERTLPRFAREHLGKHFSVEFVFGSETDRHDVPGVAEALDHADTLFVSVRRRVLPPEQMEAVRRFVQSGKPVLGIRTASHAFSLRSEDPPEGRVAWETFDADVYGGNYTNHYGNGPDVTVQAASGAEDHPILAGVELKDLSSRGSLYKVSPLAKTSRPLLIGSIPGQPEEPVAWTNKRQTGGRTFYTSLGHPEDFEQPEFRRLLRNAVYWAAEVKVSETIAFGY
jgi:type 1 glutamine amidotransferase/nicotinamidase-related amidase